jgi:hypothetical protein
VYGLVLPPRRVGWREPETFYKNKVKSDWGTVADDWAYRNEDLGTLNEIIEVSVDDFSEDLEKSESPHYLKSYIEGKDAVCLKALVHCDSKT